MVECVTCFGNTAVFSVALLPIDVDAVEITGVKKAPTDDSLPITMGISVVSGNKSEEVSLNSGEIVVVSGV